MRVFSRSFSVPAALGLLMTVALVGCGSPAPETPAATAPPAAAAGERGGQEEFGPYNFVADWPKPLADGADGVKHDGWTWSSVGAVYAESPDKVWVVQRGELPLPPGAKPWTPYAMLTGAMSRGNATGNPDGMGATCEPAAKRGWERRWHHSIVSFDRAGNMVDWWPQHEKLFDMFCGRGAHKVKMNPYDPEKHLWVIDDQLHVIHKFTHDGNLVLTHGTPTKRGRDAGVLFDRPTDIDWLPDGTYYISDGYGGTRVAKFGKDDKFIMDWGSKPVDPANPGPNEWNTVHSVQISKDNRIFVIDRGHRRMQVFDLEGKFLDMWPTGVRSSPFAHIITTDQFIWTADGGTQRIVKYDLNGKYLYSWGLSGGQPGSINGAHSLSVDQEGNFYIAEVFGGRVQKFTPKPGADPAKMVGPENRYAGAPAN